jgi:2-polyprenyl-6-hydroxyphenyl methylase/3-demethylubiquinone-9 3-methyltransferase
MRAIDNAIYDRIDTEWWSDDSFMALLPTAVNPARFDYFRRLLLSRFGRASRSASVLDVGCGGGLLTESFAQLGCCVTGVDRSLPTLGAARTHAATGGHDIRYLQGDAAALPFGDGAFDVVCCCDVLEDVDDFDAVVGEIARVLKPNGVFFFDTINRTWRSRLLAIKLAQDWAPTRLVPLDVHVWEKFIRPDELAMSLSRHGLPAQTLTGLSPLSLPVAAAALLRLKLGALSYAAAGSKLALVPSRDLSVSYMGSAARDVAGAAH